MSGSSGIILYMAANVGTRFRSKDPVYNIIGEFQHYQSALAFANKHYQKPCSTIYAVQKGLLTCIAVDGEKHVDENYTGKVRNAIMTLHATVADRTRARFRERVALTRRDPGATMTPEERQLDDEDTVPGLIHQKKKIGTFVAPCPPDAEDLGPHEITQINNQTHAVVTHLKDIRLCEAVEPCFAVSFCGSMEACKEFVQATDDKSPLAEYPLDIVPMYQWVAPQDIVADTRSGGFQYQDQLLQGIMERRARDIKTYAPLREEAMRRVAEGLHEEVKDDDDDDIQQEKEGSTISRDGVQDSANDGWM